MVFVYSKIKQVMVLNKEAINSFCLLYLVKVNAFNMLSVCFALVMVTFICCNNIKTLCLE